jgi:hypothetical protein
MREETGDFFTTVALETFLIVAGFFAATFFFGATFFLETGLLFLGAAFFFRGFTFLGAFFLGRDFFFGADFFFAGRLPADLAAAGFFLAIQEVSEIARKKERPRNKTGSTHNTIEATASRGIVKGNNELSNSIR